MGRGLEANNSPTWSIGNALAEGDAGEFPRLNQADMVGCCIPAAESVNGNKWMTLSIGTNVVDGIAIDSAWIKRNADNGGWTTFTTMNSSLPGDKILCVKARNNNEVWAGTQYGAARIKDHAWKTFTREDYPQLMGDAILGIAFDSKNNVYLSHFRGLTVISPNDSLRLLRTEHGLLSREINQVMIAANDDIWVSYNGGSNKISRSKDNGNHWEHFSPPNIEG